MPTISVIVPVYGVEKYIHRCIDSILAQTFADFELILVDDGSPDNCPAICDEYAKKDNRVRVIHQENKGLSAARNTGLEWTIANSESQWLTFVDSDDWIALGYLEKLYEAAIEKNVDISICNYVQAECWTDSAQTPNAKAETCTPDALYMEQYITSTVAWGKLYRKKCFDAIRYPVGKIHEDEFVTYRLLFAQKQIAYLPAPLYYYYANEAGITRSAWNPNRMDVFEAMQQQIRFFARTHRNEICRRNIYVYAVILLMQYDQYRASRYKTRKLELRFRNLSRFILMRFPASRKLGTERLLHLVWLAFPGVSAVYHRMKK